MFLFPVIFALCALTLLLRSLTPFVAGDAKKKKKKKKPKKKSAKPVQSDPPRVGLSKFFPDGNYPVGEVHEYKDKYEVEQLCG